MKTLRENCGCHYNRPRFSAPTWCPTGRLGKTSEATEVNALLRGFRGDGSRKRLDQMVELIDLDKCMSALGVNKKEL